MTNDCGEDIVCNQKRNKRGIKKRTEKVNAIARMARDATLSIRLQKTAPICNKDLMVTNTVDTTDKDIEDILETNTTDAKDVELFKRTFFPERTVEYSRLPEVAKLQVCQLALQYSGTGTRPFVFRLPTKHHGKPITELRKIIQRKLKSKLGYAPLIWMTGENDGYHDKTITHINGEIGLTTPNHHAEELEIVRAFREIYGNNPGVHKCIHIPTLSRNKQTKGYGGFYATYNWVGYSTKQELDRERESNRNKITKRSTLPTGKHYAISEELNRQAANMFVNYIK